MFVQNSSTQSSKDNGTGIDLEQEAYQGSYGRTTSSGRNSDSGRDLPVFLFGFLGGGGGALPSIWLLHVRKNIGELSHLFAGVDSPCTDKNKFPFIPCPEESSKDLTAIHRGGGMYVMSKLIYVYPYPFFSLIR